MNMRKVKRYVCVMIPCILLLLCKMVPDAWSLYQQRSNFVPNQKNEPYSQKVVLHEMDFRVYRQYFSWGVATASPGNQMGKIALPCDVEYYETKQDKSPALTIEKGTEVYLFPGSLAKYYGYGAWCWPDYESDWRYGKPFHTKDLSVEVEEDAMFYVKENQIRKVVEAYWRENRKELQMIYAGQTDFANHVVEALDKILYDNGVFCR